MTDATELLTSDLDLVVEEIRAGERFLLTTHENPDGDALGSLLAMHQRILEALGKDSVMFLAAKEFPLPVEYRFLPLEEVFHEPPADIARSRRRSSSTAGTSTACRSTSCATDGTKVINIDHHHDNTRFGTVNLVDVDASCTAEIVYDLAGLLGVEMTPEIANALYVGLVTDTGKFMYENTDARSHRMAAELIEAGVEVERDLPPPLRARADREAQAARPRARRDRAAATTAGSRSPTSPPTTTRRPAPARRSPRGSSTTCGRSTGPWWRPSSATRPTAAVPPAR